jgi:hypothetical protein
MESRFDFDFSRVRVHDDPAASASARDVGAAAYTLGQHLVFASRRYAPGTAEGRRLLAHELAHVVQQGGGSSSHGGGAIEIAEATGPEERDADRLADAALAGDAAVAATRAPPRLARQKDDTSAPAANNVAAVDAYLSSARIDFHTAAGLFRYTLHQKGLSEGNYTASVTVTGDDVDFKIQGAVGSFEFWWEIKPGQPNPATFFAGQSEVPFNIHTGAAPALNKSQSKDTSPDGGIALTPEEAKRRCDAGDLPGIMVFPFRGTRFGAAPVEAEREGDDIVVHQPVYVLADDDFRKQTRTLPLETFSSGVHLKPNQLVRVHVYTPHWYQLNITGSAEGDEQKEFCVTGEQMLQIADASTTATIVNIGLTVVDAASLFIPVGKIAQVAGRPLLAGARVATTAGMLGLGEAVPVLGGAAASRATTTIVEEQVVTHVGEQVLTKTISQTVVKAGEAVAEQAPSALAQTVPKVAGTGVGDVAGRVAGAGVADVAASALKPAAPSAQPLTSTPTGTTPTGTSTPTGTPATTGTPAPTGGPTTGAPVPAPVPAPTAAVSVNVLKPLSATLTPAEVAQIQQVEQRLSSIVAQAAQDVQAGRMGNGAAAQLLRTTPTTHPLYSARLGNAIQEAATDRIVAEQAAGTLPSGLAMNLGRQLPGGGRFVPLRPDIRLPLGAGREAIWDITTVGQAGHASPKYVKGFVEYLAEILY